MHVITRVLIGAFIGLLLGWASVLVAITAYRGLPGVAQALGEWVAISYFAGWPLATIGAVAGAAQGIVHELRQRPGQSPNCASSPTKASDD